MSDLFNLLITPAWAQGQPTPPPAMGFMNIIFLVVLVILFYFLLIRPQQKRTKEHTKLVESLRTGDDVMTEGGLMGRITELADNAVTLEISENVKVKMRRQSIASVLPKGTLEKL